MKYLLLACVCALCASPLLLRAGTGDGIQMLSESYHINASWNVDWLWSSSEPYNWQPYPAGEWSAGYDVSPSGEITGGYDLSSTDGSPVTATTACASPLGWSPLTASASIGLFSLQNNADSTPEGYVFPNPEPLGGYVVFQGSVQTLVQADWLFSPVGTSLQVGINGSFFVEYNGYAGAAVSLLDNTTGESLLNIVNPNLSANYTFAANPSDAYELEVSGWSDTYDSDYTDENFTASITSVPEPEVNWLLPLGFLLPVRFRNGSGTGNRLDPVRVQRKRVRS